MITRIKHCQTKILSSVAPVFFLNFSQASQRACVHILMPYSEHSLTRLRTKMWGRNPEWELDVWPLWPQEAALTQQSVTSWDAHTARRLFLSPCLGSNLVSLALPLPFVPLCFTLNETLPRFSFLCLFCFCIGVDTNTQNSFKYFKLQFQSSDCLHFYLLCWPQVASLPKEVILLMKKGDKKEFQCSLNTEGLLFFLATES